MTRKLVVPEDVVAQPWRNGLGTRRVLLSTPEWRISLAEIEGRSAFSAFPGTDRLLVPLTAPGVMLQISGEQHDVAALSPIEFRGEDAVRADAREHRIQVINVMTTRSVAARSHVIGTGALAPSTSPDAVVILDGSVHLGPRVLTGGTLLLPAALRTAVFDPDATSLRLFLAPRRGATPWV